MDGVENNEEPKSNINTLPFPKEVKIPYQPEGVSIKLIPRGRETLAEVMSMVSVGVEVIPPAKRINVTVLLPSLLTPKIQSAPSATSSIPRKSTQAFPKLPRSSTTAVPEGPPLKVNR